MKILRQLALLIPFASISFVQFVIVKNATINNGSGKPSFRGDVQIKGDKISSLKQKQ